MILIMPMAGRGSRFTKFGEPIPKPFIMVNGKHMFARSLSSVPKGSYTKVIFILLKEHHHQYDFENLLAHYEITKYEIVCLDEVTEGQLCTVNAASCLINKQEDILVIACDTYIDSDIILDIKSKPLECDGIISVIKQDGNHWSFAKFDESNNVLEVAEKNRISEYASTGIYYFTFGSDFCEFAAAVIKRNERVAGEFYIMLVYKYMLEIGKKLKVSFAKQMWDMGNPEAKFIYESYLNDLL
jgi:NDP-sugar pyrophosphorylase family protein